MNEIERQKGIVRTSLIGILGNILLVGFKAVVGFIAGSISIIMDALNNLTDALSSLITIVGTKLSSKKANKKHPYGYGRIEYITSTLIAALILFAGGTAIYESVKSIIDHFQNGSMPEFEVYSLVIIAGAILIKILIGLFFRIKAKKYDSDALKASGTDALFDSVLSTSTLVGAIVAKYAGIYIEGYLGIIIGLLIIKSGFEVLKESLSSMIGDRFEKEYIQEIKKEIISIDGVLGAYDLILNSYGYNKAIGSVHIGVDDNLTAKEIQTIEREIATMMYDKYNTIMTIGIYAENTSDEETKRLHQIVVEIIKNYPNVLQMHGFYLDKDKKILNYDLVISFDEKEPNKLIEEIKNKNKEIIKDYQIIINFDQDFSLS